LNGSSADQALEIQKEIETFDPWAASMRDNLGQTAVQLDRLKNEAETLPFLLGKMKASREAARVEAERVAEEARQAAALKQAGEEKFDQIKKKLSGIDSNLAWSSKQIATLKEGFVKLQSDDLLQADIAQKQNADQMAEYLKGLEKEAGDWKSVLQDLSSQLRKITDPADSRVQAIVDKAQIIEEWQAPLEGYLATVSERLKDLSASLKPVEVQGFEKTKALPIPEVPEAERPLSTVTMPVPPVKGDLSASRSVAAAEAFYKAKGTEMLDGKPGKPLGQLGPDIPSRSAALLKVLPGVSEKYLTSRGGKVEILPDVHGNMRLLIERLIRDRIISDVVFEKDVLGNDTKDVASFRYTGGKAEVIFLGDLLDRDDYSQEVFDFVRDLQQKAREQGGEVIRIAGNHEQALLQLYSELRKQFGAEIDRLLTKTKTEGLNPEDENELDRMIQYHLTLPPVMRVRIANFYENLMTNGYEKTADKRGQLSLAKGPEGQPIPTRQGTNYQQVLQALRLGQEHLTDAREGDLRIAYALPPASPGARQIVAIHGYVAPHFRFTQENGQWVEMTGTEFADLMNKRFKTAAEREDFVTDLMFRTGNASLFEPAEAGRFLLRLNDMELGGPLSTYHQSLKTGLPSADTYTPSETMVFVNGHTADEDIWLGPDYLGLDTGMAKYYNANSTVLKISLGDKTFMSFLKGRVTDFLSDSLQEDVVRNETTGKKEVRVNVFNEKTNFKVSGRSLGKEMTLDENADFIKRLEDAVGAAQSLRQLEIGKAFIGDEDLLVKGLYQVIDMKIAAAPRSKHAQLVIGDDFAPLLENPETAYQFLNVEDHQVTLAGLSQKVYDKLTALEHLASYLTPTQPGAPARLRILKPGSDLAAVYSEMTQSSQFGPGVPVLGTDEALLKTFARMAKDRVFSIADKSDVKAAAFLTTTEIAKYGDSYLALLKQRYDKLKERDGVLIFDSSIEAILLEFYKVAAAQKLTSEAA